MNSAIVIVIDRLNAGFLGPYGNTWIETPNLNRLAVESALFEFAISDSPLLPLAYRSLWSGRHAMAGLQDAADLPEQASRAGLHTALLTDSAEVAELPGGDRFDERLVLPEAAGPVAAEQIDQSHLARLIAQAVDWLQQARGPFVLWVHSCGMQGPWDAPRELREQFADEEDPLPPDFVVPPLRRVAPDEDPDLLLGIQHAYAGQISLLDACLGGLLEACEQSPTARDALLLLTSPRAYPLGEHLRVGPVDEAIYGEHLHVPCLVRVPDRSSAAVRCHELVQPADVHATLAQWCGLPAAPLPPWGRDLLGLLENEPGAGRVAAAISGPCSALRTPEWFLHAWGEKLELFAKPDDRWEANEVSNRCRDLLPRLTAMLDEFQRAARDGDPDAVERLSLDEAPAQ